MKYLSLFFLASSQSLAATWVKVSTTTLRLAGNLSAEDGLKFRAAIDDKIRELVVDSGGGSVAAGLEIAEVILNRKLKVTVEGVGFSSCANYLFSVAPIREIRNGLVGYHGNATACYGPDMWPKRRVELIELGFTESQIEQLHTTLKSQIEKERSLFNRAGVSQSIFDRSCRPDKGKGDGAEYVLLLPTGETFKKNGIHGVIGSQSVELMENLTFKVLVD